MMQALHAGRARVGHAAAHGAAAQRARLADAVHTPTRARAARGGHASLPPLKVPTFLEQLSQNAQTGRDFSSASGPIRGINDPPAESLTSIHGGVESAFPVKPLEAGL